MMCIPRLYRLTAQLRANAGALTASSAKTIGMAHGS
jgi:hypothetical protein